MIFDKAYVCQAVILTELTRRVSSSAGSGVGDLTKGTTTGDVIVLSRVCWGLGTPNAVIG